MHEKVLYDLIRIAAQEIRIVYELFDFYTNYDTNCLYHFDTNCIQITYELYTKLCEF